MFGTRSQSSNRHSLHTTRMLAALLPVPFPKPFAELAGQTALHSAAVVDLVEAVLDALNRVAKDLAASLGKLRFLVVAAAVWAKHRLPPFSNFTARQDRIHCQIAFFRFLALFRTEKELENQVFDFLVFLKFFFKIKIFFPNWNSNSSSNSNSN